MRIRVTAIVVAKHGGEWLDETLAGLAAQTRTPDRVIGVINGGRETVAKQFAAGFPAARVVTTQREVPFGGAVQQGVTMIPSDHPSATLGGAPLTPNDPSEIIQDWYWLLTEDSAPEPAALHEILSTVLRAPSVAIAGPKLVDWHHPDRIIELGQSLTRSGERWLLRRQERDQQQYDHLQDTLGVGPVGMLVRVDAWRQLEGFDPAYRVYDDGLDLSVRSRLAGYRVVVSPASRVRFARRGIAGPRIERSRHVLRIAHREARTAQLHRRIAYAPALAAFFTWLVLPVIALGRMAWALIREQPGNLWGEFASAMRVFFTPGSIIASRRRVKAANTAGWGAVRPLQVDAKTVRTARMIDREAILAAQGRTPRDLNFIATGGLAVLIVGVLAAIGLTWWAITQTSLTGGGLAPLSSFGELWANTRTQDGLPADPINWVLALLGTLTFWNPSHAVVLLLVAAVPLAALGAWMWAAQLTERAAGRVLLALGWAFSPLLLGALAAGRLPTLILVVVLPWLLLAASRCRLSWSWAGTTSLLAAVALACAPVLAPAAVVLLIVGLFTSPRGIARVLSTAIAPIALFAPNLLSLLRGRDPFELLVDPGITLAFSPATPWQMLLGFPEYGLEGWGQIFHGLGIGIAPVSVMLGVLLLPIVLLAALGLVTGRVLNTVLHAVLGGVGLLTAVAASKLQLLSLGPDAVTVWTGSGLALYWIAMLGLAVLGANTLRRAAAPIVAVVLLAALVVVAPLMVKLATANTAIVSSEGRMPALVQAAGSQDPQLRTLVLRPVGEQAVRTELVTGPGVLLDELRTADHFGARAVQDEWLGELVGVLASSGDETGLDAALQQHGISFVLLSTDGALAERSHLQAALDQHAVLENAGQTAHGLLWRVSGAESVDTQTSVDPTGVGHWFTEAGARVLWWAQIAVLLGTLLLALPTGAVVERPERRRKQKGVPVASPVDSPAAGPQPAAGEALGEHVNGEDLGTSTGSVPGSAAPVSATEASPSAEAAADPRPTEPRPEPKQEGQR